MKQKEVEIVRKYLKEIESGMDGFFKLVRLFSPEWFRVLNYLLITSVFWYIAESTENELAYVIAFISLLLIIVPILGFVNTVNYLTFKAKVISQLLGFVLIVLPLFYLSLFTVILVVEFLTFQFG